MRCEDIQDVAENLFSHPRHEAASNYKDVYHLSFITFQSCPPLRSFWHFQVKSGLHFAPSELHKNGRRWRDFRHRLLGVLTTDQDSGGLAVWCRCDTTKTSKTLIVAQEIPLHEVKTVIFKRVSSPKFEFVDGRPFLIHMIFLEFHRHKESHPVPVWWKPHFGSMDFSKASASKTTADPDWRQGTSTQPPPIRAKCTGGSPPRARLRHDTWGRWHSPGFACNRHIFFRILAPKI